MPWRIALLLLVACCCSACSSLAARLIWGTKPPRPISSKQMHKAAQRLFLDQDTAKLLLYQGDKYAQVVPSKYPLVRVYNAKGEYLPFEKNVQGQDSATCPVYLMQFLDELSPENEYTISPDRVLSQELESLQDLAQQPLKLQEADFYAFVYWGDFLGRFGRKKYRHWDKLLKSNAKSKVKYYRVNADPQKSWGEANLRALGYKKRRHWR